MYRNLGYHAKGWTGAFGENPFKAGSFFSGKFGGKNTGYPAGGVQHMGEAEITNYNNFTGGDWLTQVGELK